MTEKQQTWISGCGGKGGESNGKTAHGLGGKMKEKMCSR